VSVVLDASALLAFLHEEPGGEAVPPALEGARVSAVNWSEVLEKSLQRQVDIGGIGSVPRGPPPNAHRRYWATDRTRPAADVNIHDGGAARAGDKLAEALHGGANLPYWTPSTATGS